MQFISHRLPLFGLACLFLSWLGVAEEPVDPFMGDWQGTLTKADQSAGPFVAQVIALGNGQYRANLLPEFDVRTSPVAVLDGKVADNILVFPDGITNDGTVFRGVLPGEKGGTFSLTHVARPSPTLGMSPPEGSVVLLDGTNLDQWNKAKQYYGLVDLRAVFKGGQDCVAYLRNGIHSPANRKVILELGSDDAIKAWLNGALIHANKAFRPCTPGEDRVEISLKEGWNELMLKIIQGGGGWAAHARVVDVDGKPMDDLTVRHAAVAEDGEQLTALGVRTDGTILCWEVAGPGIQEGRRGSELFDVVFPPEDPSATCQWSVVGQKEVPMKNGWRLLEDGAMEVVPKGGSMWSKELFTDFRLHLEFRTPFMPEARGQDRGNSGVYLQGRYEIQVLDSYGLEGRDNECGGIYKVAAPLVNMCAPPMQWQTYDVTFQAPRFKDGAKTDDAIVTILHNGVTIHDKLHIPTSTGGGASHALDTPGPILLQDHGNKVQYRNIWAAPFN